MTRHRLPIGFAVAGLLASAVAVQAAAEVTSPTAAERSYRDYHEGVYAATECRDAVFTPSDYQIIEARINERVGQQIHIGRQLQMIESAKRNMISAMSHAGCGAEEVEAALVRFDELRGLQTGSATQ